MKAYGKNKKTGSRGGRIGTHSDNCICKNKKVNKTRARRKAKEVIGWELEKRKK